MCHQHLSFAHLMEIQKAAFPLRPLEPDYPPDIGYRPYLVGFDECEKQMESYIAKLTIEIQRLQRTACKNAAFTAKWLDRTTQNSWTPYQLRHQMRQARRDQYPDTPELVHEFFLTVSSVDLPPLSDTAPELSATPTGDDD